MLLRVILAIVFSVIVASLAQDFVYSAYLYAECECNKVKKLRPEKHPKYLAYLENAIQTRNNRPEKQRVFVRPIILNVRR